MKPIKDLLSRLRRTFARRADKKGSSLAFVMAIGAALVIWVMCIMPLMSTTGTVAYQTQTSYDDYLQSRSAIEFCKSELEKIVEEKLPYTFAVVGDLDSGFSAVAKRDSNSISPRPQYTAIVSSPAPLDDKQDVPTSDTVSAICAVTPNATDPNIYDITITTYCNCEKGMVYTATFTPRGSLLIYPEAYKQSQALPLSDFVMVDGQMGPNKIWDSTITLSTAPELNFTETLLPWLADPDPEYASSLGYPGVFKTTANAAVSELGTGIGSVLTDGDLTDESWTEATAVKASAQKSVGNVWIEVNSGKIDVYLYTTAKTKITDQCQVYLNGTKTTSVPTAYGTYQVTVDYPGSEYSESGVNVLPFQGLQMPDLVKCTGSFQQQTLDVNAGVRDVIRNEVTDPKDPEKKIVTYDVELALSKEVDYDVLFGYCKAGTPVNSEDGKVHLTWSESSTITGLEPDTIYYFYICRPAEMVDGVFYTDSVVKNAGMIFPARFATSLENGAKYVIMGGSGDPYYPLSKDKTAPAYTLNDGYVTESPATLSDYAWTATGSDSSWRFQNSAGSYLDLTAEEFHNVSYNEWAHDHRFLYSCYKATVTAGYRNSIVNFSSDGNLTVTSESGNFVFRKDLNTEFTYDSHHQKGNITGSDKGVCSDHSKVETYTHSTTLYLNLSGGTVAADTNSSTVRLMILPENPYSVDKIASPSGSYSLKSNQMRYGSRAFSFVDDQLTPGHDLAELYLNSAKAGSSETLPAGIYNVIVKVNVGTADSPSYRYAALEQQLRIEKADLAADTLTVTAQRDDSHELTVHVSCSTWHENGGEHQFGYKKIGDESDAEYHWFPSDENSYTFVLAYGEYQFAVRETGNGNYNALTAQTAETMKIEPRWVELTANQKTEFVFTKDEATGELLWYKLPDGILPSRVQLVYGIPEGDDDIVWTETFSEDVRFYGAVIPVTPFGDLDHVLQLTQPVGITHENGRTSSMMRGSSLYFMGQSSSINTYGNSIFLTTDLLVLNKDIIGGGKVFVAPYSTGTGTPGDTLLFVADPAGIVRGGTTIFEGRNFYRIPANTDLCNLNAGTTAGWKIGKASDNDVKYLFRQNIFPEINLDIAYASKEQIAHIINSEIIGWTSQGVLSGSNTTDTYAGYVICAYITDMSGDVWYKANRVLIAAKATDGTNTLYVPGNLTFSTRYLSVDADQICQVGNTSFILKNLGIDQNYWDVLGIDKYYTKTLQMDYERNTSIISTAGTVSMASQICRYDDNTDLFSGVQSQPLMATYAPSELEDLSGVFTNTIKTIDRYVSLKSDSGSSSINLGSVVGASLKIYANYIYVDPSIKEITLSGAALISGNMDIYISSQESGYTTKEYLGLFQSHSAETYTGTLVYFANSVKINYKQYWLFIPVTRTKTVSPGFYYISATPDGTSLSKLADSPDDYRVDPGELKNYSIYINPDGSLSNAYVDTGLLDSNSVGAGGFSGGSME